MNPTTTTKLSEYVVTFKNLLQVLIFWNYFISSPCSQRPAFASSMNLSTKEAKIYVSVNSLMKRRSPWPYMLGCP